MLRLLLFFVFAVTSSAAFAQNKNVGIGTTTPQAQLHTTGSLRFDTLKGTGLRPVYATGDGFLVSSPPAGSTTTPTGIPDQNCAGANSTVTVTDASTPVLSADIRVRVNISHGAARDLFLYLVAPNGQVLNLAYTQRNGDISYTNIVFTDKAAQSISAGAAPFTGAFRPNGTTATVGSAPTNSGIAPVSCAYAGTVSSFAALGGGTIVPNGAWTLKVIDGYTYDVGTINNWSINFSAEIPTVAENYIIKAGSNGSFTAASIYDNGNVGIGTTAPAQKLDVAGTAVVKRLGIANSNPVANLDVVGDTLGIRNQAGSWDNLWLTVDGSTANINASGAEEGLNFKVGSNNTGAYGNGQTLTNAMTVLPSGNIGIGNTAPHAPLQFSNAIASRKLVLYELANNEHQFYGLGINSNVLRYQVPLSTTDHVFYAGDDNGDSRELVRITGTGRVGIGVTTPFSRLSTTTKNTIGADAVGGNPGSFAWSANQFGYAAQIYNEGGSAISNGLAVKVANPGALVLDVSYGPQESAGIPLFNVRANGAVGIGTNAPALRLDVIAGAAKQAARFCGGRGNNDNDGILIIQDSSSNTAASPNNELIMFLNAQGGIIGTISRNSNANSIAFNSTSDARLKTGIRPTRYGLRDLMNIQVTDYRYKGIAAAAPQTGFLAQQLYSVYPEAVTKGDDADETQPYMVDYSKLTPLLVKSVQELKAENDALKAEVAEMKAMLQSLLKAAGKR